MKNQVLVAQLGARKHYQEPLLFHRHGMLDKLYTDFYFGHEEVNKLLENTGVYNHLPSGVKKYLERSEPELENATIIQFPLFGYLYKQTLEKVSPEDQPRVFIWAGKEFCQKIIKRGIGKANIIYGFNSACLELFQWAKKQNIYCILDQTLADYSLVNKILLQEEKSWKDWSLSPFTINKNDVELMEREHEEQDLADRIICGSGFVKNSLIVRGVSADKIKVIPLGRLKQEDKVNSPRVNSSLRKGGEKLNILFGGTVGLRKGIPYLLEALRQIEGVIPFNCKIVGSIEIQSQRIAQYSDLCEFTGRIPRSEMGDLYRWADVFVLPSLAEGSAMVTYEALSLGIPIITTDNSGSLVRDGIDGFIIPPRNITAIVEKLLYFYENERQVSPIKEAESYLSHIFNESQRKLIELISHR
ncbi:MAG: hypothetical protein N5P05_000071 [Chroococcopsis gigantea SAG 12.99]|jgi:glycosyltransferase involved in cell wall biosynthesis|nr:glycosyltransferase family 4 protein [Chlorogloea purpurea SAG 13.99]MDV2998465.1 hypothetical protein [Chroococcopsis gigantea SAG 12.99]